MNIRIGLVRSLVYTTVGYLFLFVAVLAWHILEHQPNDVTSMTLTIGLGLCVALVNLLMIGGALVSLHWPKRLAAVIAGAAVIAALLLGLFNWPAYLLWQLTVELAVAMGLQMMVFGGAHLAGYRLVRIAERSGDSKGVVGVEAAEPPALSEFVGGYPISEAPVPSTAAIRSRNEKIEEQSKNTDTPAPKLSVRDLFLLVTSFAFLFAALRFLQPVNIQGWLYTPLLVGGASIALIAVVVAWGMLSDASWILRVTVLAMTGPGGWIIYYGLSRIYVGYLLFSPWFYAAVSLVIMLFMSVPLGLVRAGGFRLARKPIAAEMQSA